MVNDWGQSRNLNNDVGICSYFKDNLPKEALLILNQNLVCNYYKRGQFVFYEGNFPSGLYTVDSGVILLETEGSSGSSHILDVIQKGGVLGYHSLFADTPYESSALVHEDASLSFIPKHTVMTLIKMVPEIALKLLQSVSRQLNASQLRFCGLSDKTAPERVAEAVCYLKNNYSNQNWTRQEIAEWASTTPETVIRVLSILEKRGLIKQEGRKIIVTDGKALVESANFRN